MLGQLAVSGRSRRRPMPRQDGRVVLLMAERYNRDSAALATWSAQAKKAVQYLEGEQWSAADLQKLQSENRPILTINKIKPLVYLVLGYHQTNLTDIKYLPGHDGSGTAEQAAALTHVAKQISEINQLPSIDAEVFMDGIVTGRGYWDSRLNFENNLLGEVKWRAADNFAVYPDADGWTYDVNESSHITESRWLSLEEVEYFYGKQAMVAVQPWFGAGNFSGLPGGLFEGQEETTPWRRFGGPENTEANAGWSDVFGGFYDWVDRSRQTIRMIDMQHYVRVESWFFVDLETGDRVRIPDSMTRDPSKVQRVLDYAAAKGEAMVVKRMPHRRLRQTQMIGDVLVFDSWSPYRTFTLTPFFPYFRRGKTRGMVDDLLSPQDEVNKRRSSRIDIIGRQPNGGWVVDRDSTDPMDMASYEIDGSKAGFIAKWRSKGGSGKPPAPINPGVSPIAHAQLEQEAEDDLKAIAGVNEAALGQIEAANASGRAVEARQRQTVMGIEPFMANYRRSKELCGRRTLELVQDHYTEQRVVRVLGGTAQEPQQLIINQRTAAGVINNVNLGKYAVAVDEAPLSATYLAATFEELLRLKELGMPIPDEFIIDASSIGRKDELKAILSQARQVQGAQGAPQAAPPQQANGGGAPPQPGQEAGPPVPTVTR